MSDQGTGATTEMRIIATHVIDGTVRSFRNVGECYKILGHHSQDYELRIVGVCHYELLRTALQSVSHAAPPDADSWIRLRLIAEGHDWARDELKRVEGLSVGKYKIEQLRDFGAEMLVFRATTANGGPYAVKIPWHPMSRSQSTRAMARRRQRFEHEANILKAYAGNAFPHFVDVVRNHPLRLFGQTADVAPAMIQEWIEGLPADVYVGRADRDIRSVVTRRCAFTLMEMGAMLSHDGNVYTDIKPSNLLVCDSAVRVVDAGSVSLLVGGAVRHPRVTPAYLSDDAYKRYLREEEAFAFSEVDALATVARVLMSLEFDIEVVPGKPIELPSENAKDHFRNFLRQLAFNGYSTFEDAKCDLARLGKS